MMFKLRVAIFKSELRFWWQKRRRQQTVNRKKSLSSLIHAHSKFLWCSEAKHKLDLVVVTVDAEGPFRAITQLMGITSKRKKVRERAEKARKFCLFKTFLLWGKNTLMDKILVLFDYFVKDLMPDNRPLSNRANKINKVAATRPLVTWLCSREARNLCKCFISCSLYH